MATKNISITEDAYKRLAALRKRNESFSEIIIEITGKKVKLMDYFGILSKEEADRLERNIERVRNEQLKLYKKRVERFKRKE